MTDLDRRIVLELLEAGYSFPPGSATRELLVKVLRWKQERERG